MNGGAESEVKRSVENQHTVRKSSLSLCAVLRVALGRRRTVTTGDERRTKRTC